MSPDDSDIALFRAGVVEGNILLHSKSQLVFASGYDGTRLLSDVLTACDMLDNSKVRHGFSGWQGQWVDYSAGL